MSTRSAGGVRQAPRGGQLEDARACRRTPCPPHGETAWSIGHAYGDLLPGARVAHYRLFLTGIQTPQALSPALRHRRIIPVLHALCMLLAQP